eukprot:CAMPEP_0170745370 /NCGR_PEP_ID=MMETSP0437-20130122/8258_1 /TAXON_ID=0 /ORGANISM="Sexangularia sp." /LENGTH=740 /DNA_ID=CAMNT_0011084087 /DNA_START=18 /DNA_END=2240 /DNA_ORIENTATION=-
MAAAMVGRDAEAAEHAELVQSLAYAGVSPQERHRKRRKIAELANGEEQRRKDEQLIADAVVSWERLRNTVQCLHRERLRNTVQCLHLVNIEKVCSAEDFLKTPVWVGDLAHPPAAFHSTDGRHAVSLPWTAHDPGLVFTSSVKGSQDGSGDSDASAAFNAMMSKVAADLLRDVLQRAKRVLNGWKEPATVDGSGDSKVQVLPTLLSAPDSALSDEALPRAPVGDDDTESDKGDRAGGKPDAAPAAAPLDTSDASPLPPALADSPAAGPAAAAASLIGAAVAASLALNVPLTRSGAWAMLPGSVRDRCTSSTAGGPSTSSSTSEAGSRTASRKRGATVSWPDQPALRKVAATEGAGGEARGQGATAAPDATTAGTTTSEDGSGGSSRAGSRRSVVVAPSSTARSEASTGADADETQQQEGVLALSSSETPKWVVGSSGRSTAALSLWKTTSSVIASGFGGANMEVPLVRPLSVSEMERLRVRGGLGPAAWLGSRTVSRFWQAVGPIVHVLRTRVGHLWTAGLIQLHSKEECQRMAEQAASAIDPDGTILQRTRGGAGMPDGLCFIRWSETYPGDTAVSFSKDGEWKHFLCSPGEVGRRQLVDYLLSKADSDMLLLKWILRIHPDTNVATLHSFTQALSPYKSSRTRAGKEAAEAAAKATVRRAERLTNSLVPMQAALLSREEVGHLAAVRRLAADANRTLTRAKGVKTASSRQTLANTAITCAIQARAIAADVGVVAPSAD